MIFFCNDVLKPSLPDVSYEAESRAAVDTRMAFQLIDYEKLIAGQTGNALRRIHASEEEQLAVYRGWMLRVEDYERLYHALRAKGISLVNTPEQYEHCHLLPESLHVIESYTPRTVVVPIPECLNLQNVLEAIQCFGDKPLIVKDYVKSRKHDWHEACFISSASNSVEVERVTRRFIELQSENLVGGLVLREFVPFKAIGTHSQSTMPLTKEYRLFFFDTQLLHRFEYWSGGAYMGEAPRDNLFTDVAKQVKSRFFSMDVAQRADNDEWMIVELGDAQVAGLPQETDAPVFYEKLNRALKHRVLDV